MTMTSNTSSTTEQNKDKEIERLRKENERQKEEINWLKEQIKQLLNQKYQRSSEVIPDGQLILPGLEEEELASPVEDAIEEDEEAVTTSSTKSTKKRARLTDILYTKDVPVEKVHYSIPEGDQLCSCCEETMHVMNTTITKEIKYIPASLSIVEHHRDVYSCRTCERNHTSTPIVQAPMPERVLDKTMASPSILAAIIYDKFVLGLPLTRIEKAYADQGIFLSRQTMSNWLIQGTTTYLDPFVDVLRDHLLEEPIIHADETPFNVLKEETSKQYMFLFTSSVQSSEPCVIFYYGKTRSGDHIKAFLNGFQGTLHADGYPGYHKVPLVELSGCWAHTRRKFVQIWEKPSRSAKQNKPDKKQAISEKALAIIQKLYQLEKERQHLQGVDDQKAQHLRSETQKELAEGYFAWLQSIQADIPAKSNLGKAIAYSLNQKEKLMKPFYNSELALDNNLAERGIRSFVIGRKNWMFSTSSKGANANASLYSIVETAKRNNLRIFDYLTYLFTELPTLPDLNKDTLQPYMPWSENIQATFKLAGE